MPPLLACFPVCSSFLALGLVAAVVVLVGWQRSPDAPAPPQPAAPPEEQPAPAGPPFPLWLFVVLPAAVLIVSTLIGLFGPDW